MKQNPKLQSLLNRFGGWLPVLVYLVLGVLLLVRPDWAYMVVIYGVALTAAIVGLLHLISYLRHRPAPHTGDYTLAIGLALLCGAGAVAIWPDKLMDLSKAILCASLIAAGFIYLQTAFDTKRAKAYRWWIYLITAALFVIFAQLILFVDKPADAKPVLSGILLVLAAVLATAMMVMRSVIESTDKPEPKAEPAEAAAEAPAGAEVPAAPEAAPAPQPEPAPQPAPAPQPEPDPISEAVPVPEDAPEDAEHAAPTMGFEQ